ncbi:MAG: methyl-accepting chemotaxis protein [Alphaproteobacteria bacterium]|nr:methyl-accepting chemotaxis protein [Alphaproteobacteria bacterium]
MRGFRDLSVALKLAASSVLAIGLLTLLVVLVRSGAEDAERAQQTQMGANQARIAATEAGLAMMSANNAQRGVLLAQAPQVVQQEMQVVREGMAEARRDVANALRLANAPAAMTALQVVERELTTLMDAFEQVATLRIQLLESRDQRLLPRMPEFDQAMEAVVANLPFNLSGDALESARDVVGVYSQAMSDVRLGIMRYLATVDPAAVQRVRRSASQQRVHARRIESAAPEALRQDAQRLTRLGQEIAEQADQVMTTASRMEELRRTVTNPARDRTVEQLRIAEEALRSLATASDARSLAVTQSISAQVLLTGSVIAILLVLSAWLTTRAIGAPLRRLAAAITGIAAGRTTDSVPDRDRSDEIGRIADAMEELRGAVGRAFAQAQMIEQMPTAVMTADPRDDFRISYMNPQSTSLLRGIEHMMSVKADALLGQSIDVFHHRPDHQRRLLSDAANLPHQSRIKLGDQVLDLKINAIRNGAGEYVSAMLIWNNVTAQARLADSFEAEVGGVVQYVAASVQEMRRGVETVSTSAETSGREADAVAEVSAQAGQDVQAVAASAEELAASVAEITRQVSEGAQVARAAADEARATDQTVQGLVQAAAKIGDVVRLISDIAGQTNLLALNATIEAARAGEAGKGFAVVASEVKNLASQTAKATEEIAAQIGAIQSTTEDAAGALRNIGATIERMNEVTTAIAGAVEEQGAATREIARSAAQVAEGTCAVVRRIDDVRRAAGDTGGAARAMREGAETLASQTQALRQKADSFLASVRTS